MLTCPIGIAVRKVNKLLVTYQDLNTDQGKASVGFIKSVNHKSLCKLQKIGWLTVLQMMPYYVARYNHLNCMNVFD